jgi:hypothetical protein
MFKLHRETTTKQGGAGDFGYQNKKFKVSGK